ncbi:class I SAM-dependent methyltransferase [Phenylobacterium sp.]|uniref:class I SAM-dependent methyltransferase n=1 Tax=Phenylobacterium sp. TaxID=1871053 RepID=UPI0027365895|nr:class I SAM-dependent methyltransferase [Phenylobacterium sp.]MDP3660398.1 class I SAM-dependent methyltransferase [Phenylobacterium sp.]
MIRVHDAIVDDQFGPQAAAYVTSAVHAAGEDLDALESLARAAAPARALDLGCGGGHVAYRLAAHARAVTACDLSPEMLAAVAASARERGLANIETRQSAAERLPFEDATFDFLGCRFSAHHWLGFEAGLSEARRVLKPGCTAVFIDAMSPGRAALDTHLQAVELLRDTSHVRDYSAGEWQAALTRADFDVRQVRTWRLRMEYASWTARMRTPDLNSAAIRALQAAASVETVEHFAIEADGSFTLDALMIEAVAA